MINNRNSYEVFYAVFCFMGGEKVVWVSENEGNIYAYPDTLVGTDSHTTMVNSLSVLGWGVGGIEAEAAMLGQPISMLIPEVIGFKLNNKLTVEENIFYKTIHENSVEFEKQIRGDLNEQSSN